MFKHHVHQWKRELITYAEPRLQGNCQIVNPEGLEKIALGVTTVLYRCDDLMCAELKTVEMLGKVISGQELSHAPTT